MVLGRDAATDEPRAAVLDVAYVVDRDVAEVDHRVPRGVDAEVAEEERKRAPRHAAEADDEDPPRRAHRAPESSIRRAGDDADDSAGPCSPLVSSTTLARPKRWKSVAEAAV